MECIIRDDAYLCSNTATALQKGDECGISLLFITGHNLVDFVHTGYIAKFK